MSEPVSLRIDPNQRHLMDADGRPFFYLADTAWSALTNPTIDEWAYYIDVRRRQGFNAIQINSMPQGDRSDNTWDAPMPFHRDANGKYDWNRPNDAYFERAAKLVGIAAERGIVPALVLMWGDLAQGTWINTQYKTHALPLDRVEPFVRRMVETFARFRPIWMVSGDTDLPEAAKPWYETALRTLRRLTPDLLCMFHISAKEPLPDEWPDIYTIYSGHSPSNHEAAYQQATDRWAKTPPRPILNLEPGYEAHGHSGYGRITAADVRRAAWTTILSGAKAGTAYGAHGVWSWHRTGVRFVSEQFSLEPLDWREALHLPGAWDMGFMRSVVQTHRLLEMEPRQDLLADMPAAVRMSATRDGRRFAAYVPFARALRVRLDLSRYALTAVELEHRRFVHLPVTAGSDVSMLGMSQGNSDLLVMGEAKQA